MRYPNSPSAKKRDTMTRGIFASVVAAAVVFCGFQTYVYADKVLAKRSIWGDTERSVVASSVNFSWDLYSQLANDDPSSNVFFSPFSVLSALMMTYLGSAGRTAEQMSQTLSLDRNLSRDDVHGTFKYLLKEMVHRKDKEYTLHVANKVFLQKDFEVLESFLSASESFYEARPDLVDFITESEEVRLNINQWVESETKSKIQDLLQPGIISAMTRLVLVNAIYFKADWERQFKASVTEASPFYSSPTETITVDMMRQKSKFPNAEIKDLDAQVVQLPYSNSSLNMVLILPKQKFKLAELEKKLTAQRLASLHQKLGRPSEISIYLPRFTLTQSFSLGDTLSQMGMSDLFTPNLADLSGINGKKDLVMSHVIHKAYIEVNERGSEAAAATAGVIMLTSAPLKPNVFRADHPFLFYIQDKKTDTILFFGRLWKPQASTGSRDEL